MAYMIPYIIHRFASNNIEMKKGDRIQELLRKMEEELVSIDSDETIEDDGSFLISIAGTKDKISEPFGIFSRNDLGEAIYIMAKEYDPTIDQEGITGSPVFGVDRNIVN
jgi:hypothetical protein